MSDFVPNSKVCVGTVLNQDNFDAFATGDTSLIDPNSLLITQYDENYLPPVAIVGTEGYD